jgi:hypothetical protein
MATVINPSRNTIVQAAFAGLRAEQRREKKAKPEPTPAPSKKPKPSRSKGGTTTRKAKP